MSIRISGTLKYLLSKAVYINLLLIIIAVMIHGIFIIFMPIVIAISATVPTAHRIVLIIIIILL
jgi:hypothetical protein